MEANKDPAMACLAKAQAAFQAGDIARAAKLANKAHSMYPTEQSASLSAKYSAAAANTDSGAGPDSAPATPAAESPAPAASRGAAASGNGSSGSGGSRRGYSSEQAAQVSAVLRAKSHYEVLGVARDANATVIRKAYRTLALQLHPDKNAAPRAKEACAALNTAYQVLSDENRRRQYDLTGEDQPQQPMFRRRRGEDGPTVEEELFAQMFGPHFARQFGARQHFTRFEFDPTNFGGRPRRQAHFHADNNRDPPTGQNQLIMVMLMMFFLFVLPAFFSSSEPLFSFQKSSHYNIARSMSHVPDVVYFITPSTAESYNTETENNRRRLQQLEASVLNTYIRQLDVKCQEEKRVFEVQRRRARYYGGKEPERDFPACSRMQDIFNRM